MHDRFMAAWFAHSAGYVAGALGGVVLVVWTIFARWLGSRPGAGAPADLSGS